MLHIYDKKLKKKILVVHPDCPNRECYWARINPGSFFIGRGYRSYGDSRDNNWVCGTNNARGCPENIKTKPFKNDNKMKNFTEDPNILKLKDNDGITVAHIQVSNGWTTDNPKILKLTTKNNKTVLSLILENSNWTPPNHLKNIKIDGETIWEHYLNHKKEA